MATKFGQFVREVEREAKTEGREAVEQLEAFRAHFRIGRELAEARRRKKMTQLQVAKLAHVDQAEVSNIERGAANPTINTLSALAGAVGLELGFKRASRRP